MSSSPSLWKRVGSIFGAGEGDAAGEETTFSGRVLQPPDAPSLVRSESNGLPSTPAPPAPRRGWFGRSRRAANGAEMRAAYERVVDLVGSIERHFEKQDERAGRLTDSVDRVSPILERFAETQHAQGEFIRAIATHADSTGRHTAEISETLREVPVSLKAQAGAIQSIARHMEIAHEVDTQLVHSLERFGQAVEALRESGTAQVETLERLHAGDQRRQDQLKTLVREQGRRLMLATVVGALLGLAALAAMVITLTIVTRG
jgi:chemotaxis regulatin CheY-phosphate phosphatase CheZ